MSQWTKFGKSIFTRFWAMLCQPVQPESSIGHFRQSSLSGGSVRFFLKSRLPNNFYYFLRVTSIQPTNFGKSIFNSLWCVLCQPRHPESNINYFRTFFVLDSALSFFIKARRRLRKSNFKIVFAPSLGFL